MAENYGPMNPIFSDSKIQSHYEEHGYVVLNLFDPSSIKLLLETYKNLQHKSQQPFHSTLHNPEISYRQKVFNSIIEITGDKINSVFINPRIITASFVVKEAHEESHVIIHQDWNLTDESLFPGFNVWFPLIDTNDLNGALYILPGSHKMRHMLRGTNTNNPMELCSHINFNHLKKMELTAGEVIIYDVRLLHGSPPNRSNEVRVACAVGVVPSDAQLIHLRFDDNKSSLIEYEVTPDFYFNYSHDEGFFNSLKVKRKLSPSAPWQPKELTELLPQKEKNSIFKRIFTSIKGR